MTPQTYLAGRVIVATGDITSIGRELGVNRILEGSVRRHHDTVRIVATLYDVESGDIGEKRSRSSGVRSLSAGSMLTASGCGRAPASSSLPSNSGPNTAGPRPTRPASRSRTTASRS